MAKKRVFFTASAKENPQFKTLSVMSLAADMWRGKPRPSHHQTTRGRISLEPHNPRMRCRSTKVFSGVKLQFSGIVFVLVVHMDCLFSYGKARSQLFAETFGTYHLMGFCTLALGATCFQLYRPRRYKIINILSNVVWMVKIGHYLHKTTFFGTGGHISFCVRNWIGLRSVIR